MGRETLAYMDTQQSMEYRTSAINMDLVYLDVN